jgi:chaperonin GroES
MTEVITVDNIKPVAGYILVRQALPQKQTVSGIYLPDSHEEKSRTGLVEKVGGPIYEDGREITSPAKEGQQVIYKKGWDNDVKIGDDELLLVKFDDVMAVITK